MLKKVSTNLIVQCIAVVYFATSFLTVAYSNAKYIMALCAVLIALCAAFLNSGKLRVRIDAFHLYTITFLAYCFMSILWAVNTDYTLEKSILILQILVVIFLIYLYYQDRPIDDLLMIAMFGGYVACAIVLAEQGSTYINGIVTGVRIYDDEFINANSLGMLAASSVVINFYYIIYKKKIKLWSLLSIPAFICILGAGSKKSVLMLVCGCIMLVVLKNFKKKQLLFSILRILVFLAAIIFVIYLLSKTRAFGILTRRMGFLFNYLFGKGEADHSTIERAAMAEAGRKMISEHWLAGVGIDNPQFFNVRQTYLHNNFLELLAGGGIIGFGLYYAMYVYLLYNMYKYRSYRSDEFDVCITLLLLQIVLQYAYVAYFNKETYFYFMLFFLEVKKLQQLGKNKLQHV